MCSMKESPPFLRVGTNNSNRGIRGKWAGQQEEYKRFDHLALSAASVGHARIGKVDVDCRLLFRKSKWGVLGAADTPAAVIYMDVDVLCPPGLSLKNLRVLLTLEDVPLSGERVDATRFFDEKEDKNNENNHDAGVPCQFTEFYGPHALRGSIVSTSSASPLLPRIGYGFGGLQTEAEKTRKTEIPWEVRGSLRRDSGTGVWKTLEWDIYANDLEGSRARQSSSNRIHLAFAYEHSRRPILLKVELAGKLKSPDRLLNPIMKRFRQGDTARCMTLIGPVSENLRRHLDELAMGLQKAMEMENMTDVPIEFPDPAPYTFPSVAEFDLPRQHDGQGVGTETSRSVNNIWLNSFHLNKLETRVLTSLKVLLAWKNLKQRLPNLSISISKNPMMFFSTPSRGLMSILIVKESHSKVVQITKALLPRTRWERGLKHATRVKK